MKALIEALPLFWNGLLALCGLIAALSAALTAIAKLRKPARAMQDKVNAQGGRIEQLARERAQDHEDIKGIEAGQRQLCVCMFALMDHEITGNSIEKLKTARDRLNAFLIDK